MAAGRARLGALRFGRVLVWLVYAFFVLALVILTITFFLLLFNASGSAPFTDWMYRSASRLLQPFRGIFPSIEGDNGSIFDAAVLFAILMYGIFAMFVHWIVTLLDDRIFKLRERAERDVPAQSSPAPVAGIQPPPQPGATAPAGAPPYPVAAQAPPAQPVPPGGYEWQAPGTP